MAARVFRAGMWVVQWLNQASVMRVSAWIAALLRLFNTEATQVTRTNLQTCFADLTAPEIESLCQQSLQQMVILFFEFAQLAHWPEQKLLGQILSVRGKDLLDQAYADGHGVLLLVPHFGNWELLCAFLGAHYSFAALYDPPKIASFEDVILDARRRFRGEFFAIDTAGMRGMLRVLKQGKLVALLPDQVPDRNAGVHADFFGQPALTMTLTHRLITKNRPSVLMGSVERVPVDKGFAYKIRIDAMPEELYRSDPETCARILNQRIEEIVRRAPAQYQWEYKRFKRPPQRGKMNIYRRQ